MDNASKNAGEMIDRFNLLYNRTRQSVITNGWLLSLSALYAANRHT